MQCSPGTWWYLRGGQSPNRPLRIAVSSTNSTLPRSPPSTPVSSVWPVLLRTFCFLFWYLIYLAFGSFHSTPSIILPDVIVLPLVPQPGPEAHRRLTLNATRLAIAHAFLGLMVTADKATASPFTRGWLMLLSRMSV